MARRSAPPSEGSPGFPGMKGRVVIPTGARPRSTLPASPGRRMRELLAPPDAAQRIRKTDIQDLFVLIKQVGLPDALELLELMHPEQVQKMMDLDVWQRDEVDGEKYFEWLAASVEAHKDDLKSFLEDIDLELLVFFLQKHVRLHIVDDETAEEVRLALEARNVTETPDRRYMVEMAPDDPVEEFLLLFIDALYRADLVFAHKVLEAVRWELPSQLQETAYRLRSGRIDELGFFEFYEALSIFQPLPASGMASRRRSPPRANQEKGLEAVPLPARALYPKDGSFLAQGLELFIQRFPDLDLTHDFLRLANKVIVAERRQPGELEDIREALDLARALAGLGLDLYCEGDLERAQDALRTVHPEWFFRFGHTRTLELKKRADRLLRGVPAAFRGFSGVPADSPYREVLEGLQQFRPLYFSGLDRDDTPEQFKTFQSRAEIYRTDDALTELDAIYRFVFQFLALEPPRRKEVSRSLEIMKLDFTPMGILLTSLAQRMLGNALAPEPLTLDQLRAWLPGVFLPEYVPGQLRRLDPSFVGEVEGGANLFAHEASEVVGRAVRAFTRQALEAVRESYGALDMVSADRIQLIGGPLFLITTA